ncbi:MAG TPA: HAMP domain-containing sensor histidine kinase [Pseudoflavonifractor sp.]|nr:HAMP domain-containing sensor histidine kinase [Pseudoflavonifractor sp.]
MLRNRVFRTFLVAAAGISLVATGACLAVNLWSGLFCFLGCMGVLSVGILFTRQRYHELAELSLYLQRVVSGEVLLDIRDNSEGELSILKNEIYKAANALTQQADALKRDKSELAAALSDISHQLKTPLTSLGIMADLLEEEHLPTEKRGEFLASMRQGLDRMEWLVLTLLKLARLDADAAVLTKTPILLSELTERALSPMLIPIEIKEQIVHVQGEDTHVQCDPNWTVEALGNIIKNAVENTPIGTVIDITYGKNLLYTFIQVRDNGPGIDSADLPHLFKRFYRGNKKHPPMAEDAGQNSVGIGLAMSRTILRKQNGDIDAMNDNGAVFTLKLYR